MRFLNIIIFTILLLSCKNSEAGETLYSAYSDCLRIDSSTISSFETTSIITIQELSVERPNPILQLIKKTRRKNKKAIAAILAFPFPFGIVGLHRIYLGTAPYVPVVYIGTAGGIFGILPFIDFCHLVWDKDFDRFQNNKNVFMWVN